MASNITKPFVVIQIKNLPVPRWQSFQCIPSSWVQCVHDDRHVTVGYPNDPTSKVEKMIINGKPPLRRWPLIPAVFVVELYYHNQWVGIQRFIKENDGFEVNDLASRIEELLSKGTYFHDVYPTPRKVTSKRKESIENSKTPNNKAKLDVPGFISLNNNSEVNTQRTSNNDSPNIGQIEVDKDTLVKLVQIFDGLKPLVDVIRKSITQEPRPN